ncbi:hypothetical protein NDR87_33225 [Nocardia sp. CDC159]|uniref:Uncharacterized protein n=1 Tax=Nocardia pulmonis TaxID=2951408 RepID=A0A9X2J0A7_9NOCA|nr:MULTISPECIES: hypothetical protein [Nocardia]MCM6778358.1 hypothetical protein [Nocardia pulmonis]MCM6791246.1 hypothetical protein [Nocardia sp. CDC159]
MTEPREIAERLLDAQVDFLLAEVSGERFAEVVARDVAAVIDVADSIVFRDVVTVEQAKQTVRKLVDRGGDSPLLAELLGVLSDALYQHIAANEDYTLGDVVDREPVEALLAKILSMHATQERLLDRLSEAPTAGPVAAKFTDMLIDDILEANKKLAGKVPGVNSLMTLGQSAVKTARKAAEGSRVGDLAAKGTLYALKRVTNAIRETLREAPVHGAAMEFWDLHSGEPVAGLRDYLTQAELRELVLLVHEIVRTTRNKEYVGLLLDESVEVFFTKYGDHTLAALLPELAITPDDIAEEILRYGPAVVEAAKRNGVLAKLIRERLEPFYTSEQVLGILADA